MGTGGPLFDAQKSESVVHTVVTKKSRSSLMFRMTVQPPSSRNAARATEDLTAFLIHLLLHPEHGIRRFLVAEPNGLMLFGERVAVYCENRTEHTKSLRGQNVGFWDLKSDGTYNNHCTLKRQSL
jgi:hypothetical protein